MHTVIPITDHTGDVIEYRVVYQDTANTIIARFDPKADEEGYDTALNAASHFCNRLNGGYSSELGAIVLRLGPILDFIQDQMAKEKANGG